MDNSYQGKITNDFTLAWDDYAEKYNKLADTLRANGIDTCLLDEVIKSKINFLKVCLNIKFDEISKY